MIRIAAALMACAVAGLVGLLLVALYNNLPQF